MLDLKPFLATRTLHPIHHRRSDSIFNLPSELLDLILEILYNDGGRQLQAVAPASHVCRQFRKSAVPLMFEIASCIVRENNDDHSRRSYNKHFDAVPLLQHVKILYIRKALRTNDEDPATTPSADQLEGFRCQDMQSLRRKISRMPQLQIVR